MCDSSGDDEDADFCARMSSALESQLSFHQEFDWAEQGGGARKYTSFHVDSYDEEDDYGDDLVFTATQSVSSQFELSNPTNEFPNHAPFQEHATPTFTQGNGAAVYDDDGWNSDDPDIFRPQSSSSTSKARKNFLDFLSLSGKEPFCYKGTFS